MELGFGLVELKRLVILIQISPVVMVIKNLKTATCLVEKSHGQKNKQSYVSR